MLGKLTKTPLPPAIVDGSQSFREITIRWPCGSNIPTIRGKWKRLADGRIEATYTRAELAKCFEMRQITGATK